MGPSAGPCGTRNHQAQWKEDTESDKTWLDPAVEAEPCYCSIWTAEICVVEFPSSLCVYVCACACVCVCGKYWVRIGLFSRTAGCLGSLTDGESPYVCLRACLCAQLSYFVLSFCFQTSAAVWVAPYCRRQITRLHHYRESFSSMCLLMLTRYKCSLSNLSEEVWLDNHTWFLFTECYSIWRGKQNKKVTSSSPHSS